MCYFTKKVLNKRFLPNRKNGWNPPVCTDERFRYVEVECEHCFECRKKKRREWRIRNYEQLKETPIAIFFTGTVSPQRYEYICKQYGYKNDGSQDNEIITKIQRLFLERIRKEKGYSITHQTYTHTRTILCNARRDKVATDKDTIRELDRRIQVLRIIRQRKKRSTTCQST